MRALLIVAALCLAACRTTPTPTCPVSKAHRCTTDLDCKEVERERKAEIKRCSEARLSTPLDHVVCSGVGSRSWTQPR